MSETQGLRISMSGEVTALADEKASSLSFDDTKTASITSSDTSSDGSHRYELTSLDSPDKSMPIKKDDEKSGEIEVIRTSTRSNDPTTTAATTAIAPPEKKVTSVSFSSLQIREYPIRVGDNPSIMTGTPLTIDWVHVNVINCGIDEYESGKPPPRTMVELRIPGKCRYQILKNQGFSQEEIRRGTRAANICRSQRTRTQDTMQLAPLQESLEKVKKATLNATFRRKRKSEERKLLKPYKSSS